MIALDTNAIVRMLVEDDFRQAEIVKAIITQVESAGDQILILPEVLIETVWVLESVYQCTRAEISGFLETLIHTPAFTTNDPTVIRGVVSRYRHGGDFADLMIVIQAKRSKAKRLVSFDKKLQKMFPDYVVETLPPTAV
mgnify:CR=1 FL=1